MSISPPACCNGVHITQASVTNFEKELERDYESVRLFTMTHIAVLPSLLCVVGLVSRRLVPSLLYKS